MAMESIRLYSIYLAYGCITFGQSMVSLIFTPAGPTGVSRRRLGDDEDAATQK